jgi:hypothetical protein
MKYLNYVLLLVVSRAGLFAEVIPKPLSYYNDDNMKNIYGIISHRIQMEPFNLVATLIFFAAVIHTFLTSYFLKVADKLEREEIYDKREDIHMLAKLFHFIGEIETVFGLWTIALAFAAMYYYDWETFVEYVGHLHYTEPMSVVVIMTISAHLLADKFFDINPGKKIKYVTVALLFVNVSVGGTLTNFAAPPIPMVAGPWGWTGKFMFINFGIKVIFGIFIINMLYFVLYRKELQNLKENYVKNRFKRYIQRKFISQHELKNRLNEI